MDTPVDLSIGSVLKLDQGGGESPTLSEGSHGSEHYDSATHAFS